MGERALFTILILGLLTASLAQIAPSLSSQQPKPPDSLASEIVAVWKKEGPRVLCWLARTGPLFPALRDESHQKGIACLLFPSMEGRSIEPPA